MYLFFDTETTGLPKRWNAPVTEVDNWPRLVQLAWISCDEQGNRLACRSAGGFGGAWDNARDGCARR